MNRFAKSRGFTLIELLTVIAIIAILAGILIPTVSSVRVSAKRAETKVRFNQWALALENFRQEYGYYPTFDASNVVNPVGQSSDGAGRHLFHDILAAKRRNGEELPQVTSGTISTEPEAQNRKRISFYQFSEREITPSTNLICDGFGQTSIVALVDRNLDGVIQVGADQDYSSWPTVIAADGSNIAPKQGTEADADIPLAGIRASVAFYAPAPDASANNRVFIFSWK